MKKLLRAFRGAANEITIEKITNMEEEVIISNKAIFLKQPFTVATNNYPCLTQKCGIAN